VSSAPAPSAPSPSNTDRRSHSRKRLGQLAYIGFGPDTGGVLLDISEEGLCCQIVGAVVAGDKCHLKFALPGQHAPIEADGQVVWANQTKQGGGVRLVAIGTEARQHIQEWIGNDMESPAGVPIIHMPASRRIAPVQPAPPAATALEPAAAEPAPSSASAAPAPAGRLHVVPAIPQPAAAIAAGPKTSAPAQANRLRPAQTVATGQRALLSGGLVEAPARRFPKAAALAGCMVAGVVALAFSGFNPAHLWSPENDAATIAPVIAAPVPPVAPAPTPSDPTHVVESSTPLPAGSAAEVPPRAPNTVNPPPRAAVPAAPVTQSRPPAPVRPPSRQSLALSRPRARAVRPAVPSTAAPETLAPPSAAGPMVDMQTFGERSPEIPRPAGMDFKEPELISRVEPAYSPIARQARLQGTVRINTTVGTDGLPRSPVCVSGNAALCQMAIQAVGKWRYRPATSDGRPIEAQTLITFNFQIR